MLMQEEDEEEGRTEESLVFDVNIAFVELHVLSAFRSYMSPIRPLAAYACL